MKRHLYSHALALLAASSLTAADTTTTKTTTTQPDGSTETTIKTTTSAGTVTQYVPGTTFIMKETTGPVTYRYGKTVTYVNRAGKPISSGELNARLKIGAPVTVDYVIDGQDRVISRIVINE